MLGPLPPLHRWVVGLLAVVACVGLGAWLAAVTPIPLLPRAGAGVGAALGAVVVALLLHHHDGPRTGSRPPR